MQHGISCSFPPVPAKLSGSFYGRGRAGGGGGGGRGGGGGVVTAADRHAGSYLVAPTTSSRTAGPFIGHKYRANFWNYSCEHLSKSRSKIWYRYVKSEHFLLHSDIPTRAFWKVLAGLCRTVPTFRCRSRAPQTSRKFSQPQNQGQATHPRHSEAGRSRNDT